MSYGCGRVQCANILSLLFCAALYIYMFPGLLLNSLTGRVVLKCLLL